MKVGTAKYGVGKKIFKIKDGDNVYRILPPLGNLADVGKWAKYYRVEWGYKNSKGENRPFQDCRVVNRENKMVEVESAAYLKREELKKNKEAIVEAFKNKQATQEQVKEATELTRRYNLDCKWYLNVVNLNGEIGLLKIGHKAKQSLDAAIEKLRKRGVDPLSLENGRFFNFYRNNPGTGFRDITTEASVYCENVQATINGQTAMVQQEKVHVMDDTFISRLATEAFELADMYPTPTADEVARMVKEGAPAVDEILGFSDRNSKKSTETAVAKTEVATPAVTPEPNTTPVNVEQPTTNDSTITTATPSVKNDTVVVSKTDNNAPTNTEPKEKAPESNTTMSDDEFLKSIGAVE